MRGDEREGVSAAAIVSGAGASGRRHRRGVDRRGGDLARAVHPRPHGRYHRCRHRPGRHRPHHPPGVDHGRPRASLPRARTRLRPLLSACRGGPRHEPPPCRVRGHPGVCLPESRPLPDVVAGHTHDDGHHRDPERILRRLPAYGSRSRDARHGAGVRELYERRACWRLLRPPADSRGRPSAYHAPGGPALPGAPDLDGWAQRRAARGFHGHPGRQGLCARGSRARRLRRREWPPRGHFHQDLRHGRAEPPPLPARHVRGSHARALGRRPDDPRWPPHGGRARRLHELCAADHELADDDLKRVSVAHSCSYERGARGRGARRGPGPRLSRSGPRPRDGRGRGRVLPRRLLPLQRRRAGERPRAHRPRGSRRQLAWCPRRHGLGQEFSRAADRPPLRCERGGGPRGRP